ncbi:MAG: response regulator [Algicola sp.]|nr:response regulator [Algicola sp.]
MKNPVVKHPRNTFERQLNRSFWQIIAGTVVIFAIALLSLKVISDKTEKLNDLIRQQNILTNVKAMVADSDKTLLKIIYLGERDSQAELLAMAEDFLSLFGEFKGLAKKYQLIDDLSLAEKIEPDFDILRERIVEVVVSTRSKKYLQAQSLYTVEVQRLLGEIGIFINDTQYIKNNHLINIRREIEQAQVVYGLILVVAVILILLVIYLGHRRISRQTIEPLHQLTLASDVITRFYGLGDLSQHSSLPSADIVTDYQQALEQLDSLSTIYEIKVLAKGFATMAQSVSDKVAALETINNDFKASRDEALQAVQAKRDFLANMSHEIRTPLNGLLGMSQLLMKTALDSDQYSYAKTINDSGKSLMVVLDDTLDLSKIEAGQMKLQPEAFDLEQCLGDVCALSMLTAGEKGLALRLHFERNCPTGVVGDPHRIKQIVLNLLTNAIKFTATGGVDINVSLDSDAGAEPVIKISVKDSGIGLSVEAIGRLFTPFSQADHSSTRAYGGTGLGLAICKSLINAMNGYISVKTMLGQGAEFWFTLPLPRSPKSIARWSGLSPQGLCLVVDGDRQNASISCELLSRFNLSVAHSAGVEQMVKMLDDAQDKGRPFELLVIDQQTLAQDDKWLQTLSQQPQTSDIPRLLLHPPYGERQQNTVQLFGDSLCYPLNSIRLGRCLKQLFKRAEAGEAAVKTGPKPQIEAVQPQVKLSADVLLVEDTLINQMVAQALLQKAGVTVTLAQDGEEAVALFKGRFNEGGFDLILMDCLMPKMDGFEATRIIRQLELQRTQDSQNQQRVPIVALTASALSDTKEQCFTAGMDDFISKPFTEEVLFEKLKRWVG